MRLLSASRRRRAIIRASTSATPGVRSRKPVNASRETAMTSTGSSAVAVAERGPPSRADISPMRSPGSRMPSRASRPPSVTQLSFTRPAVRTSTASPGSRSWKSGAPTEKRRVRAESPQRVDVPLVEHVQEPRIRRLGHTAIVTSPTDREGQTTR